MDLREPTPSLPNWSIISFADTYFEAGNLLCNEKPGRGLYLPAANLLCHSIELYLKSLANPAMFKPVSDEVFKEVTWPKNGHRLSEMLETIEPIHKDELTEARCNLKSELESIEGLFQAARYPFEKNNRAFVTQGKDKTAFAVAQFLNRAVRELKPILVH